MQRLFALLLGFAVVGIGNAQWENDPPEVLLGAGEERKIEWLADSDSLQTLLRVQAQQPRPDGAPAQLQIFERSDGLILLGSIGSSAQTTPGNWVWRLKLATMAEVQLPPIGWQRAEHPLRNARDCTELGLDADALAYCPEWFAAQERHRQQLLALLQRSYRVSADGASQDSTAAFSQLALDQGMQELAAELPPGLTRLDNDHGQHFVWLIPWESLPALHELTLQTVHLQVSVCEPDENRCLPEILGPGGQPLPPGETATLSLPQPLRMQLSRCDLPARDQWEYPSLHRIPPLELGLRVVARRFHLALPGGGYLDRPDPNRLSPELVWEEDSSLALAEDQWICGPDMVYQLREQSIAATQLDLSGDPDSSVPDADFESSGELDEPAYTTVLGGPLADQLSAPRQLDPHRWLLVQPYRLDAPSSGEGQNGACERVSFSAWIANDQEGYLRRALSLDGYGPDLCAGWGYVSIEMADDAGSVAVIRRQEVLSEADERELAVDGATTSGPYQIAERYCLDLASDTYLLCGQQLLRP